MQSLSGILRPARKFLDNSADTIARVSLNFRLRLFFLLAMIIITQEVFRYPNQTDISAKGAVATGDRDTSNLKYRSRYSFRD